MTGCKVLLYGLANLITCASIALVQSTSRNAWLVYSDAARYEL